MKGTQNAEHFAEVIYERFLDVVAVEAHEDDVDDDAERDGQLHEGVEHHEGQDLAQLHQGQGGGCTRYGLDGIDYKCGTHMSVCSQNHGKQVLRI